MTVAILDASAFLALLLGEAGADIVMAHRSGAIISAVNYAEVVTRTAELSGSLEDAKRRVDRHDVDIVPLDRTQAAVAASLLPVTKRFALSLADRCCLALGLTRGLPVLTADRVWQQLTLDIEIILIR